MFISITSLHATEALYYLAPRYTLLNIIKSGLCDLRSDAVLAPHTFDSQGKSYFTWQNKPLSLCHQTNRGFIPGIPRNTSMLQFIQVLSEFNQRLVQETHIR